MVGRSERLAHFFLIVHLVIPISSKVVSPSLRLLLFVGMFIGADAVLLVTYCEWVHRLPPPVTTKEQNRGGGGGGGYPPTIVPKAVEYLCLT